MKHQTMTLKPNGTPVLIPTAHGIIRLWRDPSEPRKVHTELPAGLQAFFGDDRALENSPFVTRDESGKIVPKFDNLIPQFDEAGNWLGLQEVTKYRLTGVEQ